MINIKSIISILIGSIFVITISTMSTILGAESAFTSQTLDKSFMLAQAHEHGEDKKDKSKEKKGKVIKIVTAVVNMEKKLKFMHI